MAADAEAPPPPPDAGTRGGGDAEGTGSADAPDGASYGPLRVERRRKDDGRGLILYTAPGGDRGDG